MTAAVAPIDVDSQLEEAVVARERERDRVWRAERGGGTVRRDYHMCTRTVMDTTDPDICFDRDGVCHWVREYERQVSSELAERQGPARLDAKVAQIKKDGAGREYDCVVGLSGGTDSSFLCLLAKDLGLRALVVHFDNGWDSELAIQNIERVLRRTGFDLYTFVMDWPQFRDLQRAYFLASVLDLEIPTDHLIFGSLYEVAAAHRIRHIVVGNNTRTEWLLPKAWYYSKFDLVNMRAIDRAYGSIRPKRLPTLGVAQSAWYHQVLRLRQTCLLDLVPYDKPTAKSRLARECAWRDYGGKHHESVFTRFYQGYVLPKKFNIDKRKAHLSNLILAGQLSRREALEELLRPTYDERLQREDFSFVAKKLGFTDDEFNRVLTQPNRPHSDFGSDVLLRTGYQAFLEKAQVVKKAIGRSR